MMRQKQNRKTETFESLSYKCTTKLYLVESSVIFALIIRSKRVNGDMSQGFILRPDCPKNAHFVPHRKTKVFSLHMTFPRDHF